MPHLAHLGLLLIALAVSAAVTPVTIHLCRRHGVLDQPAARKVHTRAIPRLGGVAIFVSISLALTALVLGSVSGWFELSYDQARLVPVLYLGLCGFFFIGFLDDLRSLPALPRLAAQFVVATAVVVLSADGGIRIATVFGRVVFPEWFAILITVLWLVLVVNTFNWIDGLDGLAAGIGGISALAFFILAVAKPGLPNAQLTIALGITLLGALGGFLPFNFHPARVFIGDGGAFSLGYMLGVISVIGLFKQAAVISFLVPVAILALPLTDTAFAIFRRVVRGKPVTAPDSRHIHHRMLALLSRGYRDRLPSPARNELEEELVAQWAHRSTVVALYGFTAVFAAIAVVVGIYT